MNRQDSANVLVTQRRNTKLEELRQARIATDVELECDGGTIPAHKVILLSSYEYFEKMFNLDMTENLTGRVNFKKYSKIVIEIIIRYIYTGEHPNVESSLTIFEELMGACHLMGITELLNQAWLAATTVYMTLETFPDFWKIAVRYELQLDRETIRFIKDFIQIISQSEYLKDFTKDELKQLFTHAKPNERIQCIFTWNCNGDREADAAELLLGIEIYDLDSSTVNLSLPQTNEERTTKIILKDKIIQYFCNKYRY